MAVRSVIDYYKCDSLNKRNLCAGGNIFELVNEFI